MDLPQFKNFTTKKAAYKTLHEVEKLMPELLLNEEVRWNTRDINHDDPRVLRMWKQLGEIRVNKHLIYPCQTNRVYIHNHYWPSVGKSIEGGYKHLTGYYYGGKGSKELVMNLHPDYQDDFVAENIVLKESFFGPGDICVMTSPRSFHGVAPLVMNATLFITGLPHKKDMPRSRKRITNTQLSTSQIEMVRKPFLEYYC